MNAIEKIHGFDRFGSVLGLERMKLLLEKLDHPERGLQVIHVAGTNGKGSVCRYLYESLEANGYRVGLYISPYIQRFHERIQFHGRCITDRELETYTSQVIEKADEMVREGYDSPTEFEVVTAIAFLYFAAKKVDFAILEVGLGGRGDSTNVVEKPLVSVIASIAYDHMRQLGSTLTQIAGEKAGIIKPGVPVVANVEQREAAAVIARKAYENGCALYDATKLTCAIREESAAGTVFDLEIYGTDYSGVRISMAGRHQAENAKIALMVLENLRKRSKIKVTRKDLYRGMKKARQPGRFEVFGKKPTIVLDGAHNEAGTEALRRTMESCYGGKDVLVVAGMLADKETDKMAEQLVGISHRFIAAQPDNPRKLPAQTLDRLLKQKGAACEVAETAEQAFALAMGREPCPDVVLFAGSLYFIGEIREMLQHV